MKKVILLFFFIQFLQNGVHAQVTGCTDKNALNYNIYATKNDGSCLYNNQTIGLENVVNKLSDTLSETSGLIYFNQQFWSLNDGGNLAEIYAFDKNGFISHTTTISNAINNDWEELSQDDTFIYICDFGNNGGNRKDLSILKLNKNHLKLNQKRDTVEVEKIRFQLKDQTSFNNSNQSHNFDIEACIVWKGKIHIFSKNWSDYKTKHYICPKDTGFHQLDPIESIETMGLITGASVNSQDLIALCGYNLNTNKTFIWLNWDGDSLLLNNGNRRLLNIGNTIIPGQVESIVFVNNELYFTNEKSVSKQQLNKIQFKTQVNDSFLSIQSKLYNKNSPLKISIENNLLRIVTEPRAMENTFTLYNVLSKEIMTQTTEGNELIFDLKRLGFGYYYVVYNQQYSSGFIWQP